MNDLPEGWAQTKLSSLLAEGLFVDGDWIETKDQDVSGDVRLTQLADIGEGVWRDRSNRRLTSETAARLRCTYLRPGDVLVARMPDPLGRACMFPGDPQPCVTAVDVCILRPAAERVDAKWLMWFINAPRVRAEISSLQSGTTRKRISRRNLGTIAIPVPPLVEQRRIADAIEQEFSRLDVAQELLHRVMQRLAILRRLAFRRTTLTGASAVRLDTVAEVVSGQTPKGIVTGSAGGVPFYKVGDMNAALGHVMADAREYVDIETARRLRLNVRPAGTVIFPKRGGAIATNKKRVLRSPATFDLNTMGVIPGPGLDSTFLLYWFETIDLAKISDGSNVPQINHDDVAPLTIPVPALDVQHDVIAQIEREVSALDDAIATVGFAIKKAQLLRRSILEAAFNGRLATGRSSGIGANAYASEGLSGKVAPSRVRGASSTAERIKAKT